MVSTELEKKDRLTVEMKRNHRSSRSLRTSPKRIVDGKAKQAKRGLIDVRRGKRAQPKGD